MLLAGSCLAAVLLAPAARAAEEGPGRDRLEAEVKVTVGVAYLNNDAADEALKRFEEAIALDPDNGTAHFLSAVALNKLGRHREALPHLEQARAQKSSAPPGRIDWYEGEAHYWLGEHQAAITSFQSALKQDQQDAYAHFYLGLAELQAGMDKEAVASLDRAVALDPSLGASTSYFAGKAYFAQGDVAKARQEFESALKASGGSANLQKASTNYLAASEEKPAAQIPKGELRVGIAAETDSNVILEPNDPFVISDKSDNRLTLNVRGAWHPFVDRQGWTMALVFNGYQSAHQDLNEFNLTAPQSVVSFTWGKDPQGYLSGPITYTRVPFGDSPVAFSIQYGFNYYYLSGDSYMRTHEVGASLKIPEGRWTSTQIDLDYRDNTFLQFSARTGTFFQARAIQSLYLGGRDRTLRLGLRVAGNDGDGAFAEAPPGAVLPCSQVVSGPCIDQATIDRRVEDGGIPDDYDYDEREFFADISIAFPHRIGFFFQASWLNRSYDNLNSNPSLDDPDQTVTRDDDQLLLSTSVVWSFSAHWSVVGRYSWYNTTSNKRYYDYDRGIGSLGVNWTF
jgi:tetratricopeptide (TPR) repeat protein